MHFRMGSFVEVTIYRMSRFRGSLLSTWKLSLIKQFIGCPGSSCILISSVTFLNFPFELGFDLAQFLPHNDRGERKLDRIADLYHCIWSIAHTYTKTKITAWNQNFIVLISHHDIISKSITEPKSVISKLQSESCGFCVTGSLYSWIFIEINKDLLW